MKTLRSVAVALCALALALSASAKEKIAKVSFDFAEQSRVLYLFIPEKDGPMPVLILLHGSGRNGEILVESWKDLAKREGIILAGPDAFNSATWQSTVDPPEFFRAVIDQVKANHTIDQSRIYLFGHSAGAAYALFLAVVDSDLFAATAVHAGSLQTNPDGLFEQAERKMPIAIWVGDRDPNFPIDVVEASRKLFASNGFDITLHVIVNHDHNYYAISDEVNLKAWNFLKNARLPATPADSAKDPASEAQP